jgi:PAS domain S-box-containing protein/putative nucleotidyltransferase with HDIG domain
VGLVVLPLDLAELQKRNLSHFTENYAAAVFDRGGRFLMRSLDHKKWVGKSSATDQYSAKEKRAFPAVREMVGVDGVYRLRATAQVPGTDWVVVVGVPREEIVAAAKRETKSTIVTGFLILVGVLGLAYMLAQKISQPIRSIGSAARAVADGDITIRVEPTGSVELRNVAHEFNRMLEAKVLLDRETYEHQQWANNVIENTSDLTVITDVSGVIKYVSPSLRQMGGYEADEALGRNYLEFIHPDEAEASLADLQAVIQTKDAVRLAERRFRHKDGHWVALESIAKNALDEPTIAGIILNARDLTERKHAEETVRRSELRYRQLFEAAKDGILILDAVTGIVVDANPFLENLLGYAKGECIGKTLWDIGSFKDITANRAVFREQQEKGYVRYDDLPLETKDGRKVDVEFVSNVYLVEGQKVIQCNIRDIRERKRAQADIEYKNSILSTQQETSLDAILVVDDNAKIVSYNHQFVELWHIPGEMVKTGDDTPVLQSIVEQVEDAEAFRARVQYLYEHKDKNSLYEIKLKDGRTINRYSAPVVGTDGHYYGRVWYFRDITAQKDSEKHIRRLNLLYATLSGSNSAVIRSKSRLELCRRICRVIAKHGGWIGAWIGFVDESTMHIVPEAWTDSMAALIKCMPASVDPAIPEGHGPAGIAMRTGAPYFCNDVLADADHGPWRQFCAEFGVASGAAVPLRVHDASIGVINLYSGEKTFYTPDIQSLAKELGDDVSFALETFDHERRREEAEKFLAESEAKYRGLVEQDLTGIYIIQDGRFVYVNPHFAQIFGYDENEVVGLDARQLVAERDRALVLDNLHKSIAGETQGIQYEFRGQRKDGTWIDVGVHGSRAVYQGRPAVIGLLQDITERRKAQEQKRLYLSQIEQSMLGTIDAVSAMVEMRDPYTAGHERRVSEIAGAIATEMGLPENDIKGLRIAGSLHDIGKIGCPAEILSKPTRLTPPEYEIIKTHAQLGYDVLKSVHFPWPIAQIVLQHHERLDGSGYPQRLKGDAIILSARIMAVADVVEAMASHRPYRPGHGIEAALKEVEKQSGKLYDPQVVAACLRLFREKGYALPK